LAAFRGLLDKAFGLDLEGAKRLDIAIDLAGVGAQ